MKDLSDIRAPVIPGVTALTTTETIIAQVKVPANTLKVGSLIKYWASYRPSLASTHTVRIRVGAAGTISDAAVVTMSAGASASNQKLAQGISAVQAIGTTATHLGMGTEQNGTATAAGTATATSGTFNSTVDAFVSLSIQSGVANTTSYFGGELSVTP